MASEDMVEIRTPDLYVRETLQDASQDLSQDLSPDSFCDELEQAKMASLEESWKYNAACNQRWSTFQPILNRLKRIGMLDKKMKTVYDMLSVILYKYSYNVEVSITESEYVFIERYMQFFRLSPSDRSNLFDVLTRLRFCPENSSEYPPIT
jgi:hypothetical protein